MTYTKIILISLFLLPAMALAQGSYPKSAMDAIKGWPEVTQTAAGTLLQRYGAPDEIGTEKLTWYRNGVWKRTVLHRDPVIHNFPKPYLDYLEQTIDYQVPVDKFSDLAMLSGSLVANRTKGEISSSCDSEAANFLAINIAHDVIVDRMGVEDGRYAFLDEVMRAEQGGVSASMTGFQFVLPLSGSTADPGEEVRQAKAPRKAPDKVPEQKQTPEKKQEPEQKQTPEKKQEPEQKQTPEKKQEPEQGQS